MDNTTLNPPNGDLSNLTSPPLLRAISLAIVIPRPNPPVDKFLELSIL